MKRGEINALLFHLLLVYIRHVNDFFFCFHSNKIHLIYTCNSSFFVHTVFNICFEVYTIIDVKRTISVWVDRIVEATFHHGTSLTVFGEISRGQYRQDVSGLLECWEEGWGMGQFCFPGVILILIKVFFFFRFYFQLFKLGKFWQRHWKS